MKFYDEFKFKAETLFGPVDSLFDNKMDLIDAENHQLIDLDFGPTSFYTVSNGSLVIASQESKVLKIYDQGLKANAHIDTKICA